MTSTRPREFGSKQDGTERKETKRTWVFFFWERWAPATVSQPTQASDRTATGPRASERACLPCRGLRKYSSVVQQVCVTSPGLETRGIVTSVQMMAEVPRGQEHLFLVPCRTGLTFKKKFRR
jgi:hypothetical protein